MYQSVFCDTQRELFENFKVKTDAARSVDGQREDLTGQSGKIQCNNTCHCV